jgi:hypothetical protein
MNFHEKDLSKNNLSTLEQNSSCCGGPATSNASACCVKDEVEKSKGNSGCGCNSVKEEKQSVNKTACCG